MPLVRVIAGGQTGVDTGALRAARAAGLATGGWCPPDGRNESGPIPAAFGLRPAPDDRSPLAPATPRSLRTEWNVRDADATLVLKPAAAGPGDAGTAWTVRCAEHLHRPLVQLDPGAGDSAGVLAEWLRGSAFRTLNVAGPSESASPGIEALTFALLSTVFGDG